MECRWVARGVRLTAVFMAAEYVFLDQWRVDAQQDAVFEALADARTYPLWWTPTYREVRGRATGGWPSLPPAFQGTSSLHPFHGLNDRTTRTSSRVRDCESMAIFAAAAFGRSLQLMDGSKSASTGAFMPTEHFSGLSLQSCGRCSAGTRTRP